MSNITMTPFTLNCQPLDGYLGIRPFIWTTVFLPVAEVVTPWLLSHIVNQTANLAIELFNTTMTRWKTDDNTCLLPLNGKVLSDKKCSHVESPICANMQKAVTNGFQQLKRNCQEALKRVREMTIPGVQAPDITRFLPDSCKRVRFKFPATGNPVLEGQLVRTADLAGGPLTIPGGTTL